MSWVLMVFHKQNDELAAEVSLPDSVNDDVVRSFVGDSPYLYAGSFPLAGKDLARLVSEFKLSIDIDEDKFEYFLEYQQQL